MSDQALAVVERLWEELSVDDVVAGLADEAANQRIRAMLAEISERDFEVRMFAPSNLGGAAFEGSGPDGFRSVWQEWSGVFGSFRIELKQRFESDDDVVDVVRLIATTETGGPPIEQGGAAVWRIRNGKLARAEFYLDPDDGIRAVGLDPDRLSDG
jgi:ketosteroid isomerase-like protein